MRNLTVGSLLFVLCPFVVVAGDGVVALQTADPSCPDDSGDIYVDCGNGTVTDNRSGLVWLENANCLGGTADWFAAREFVAGLADIAVGSLAAAHDCGLSDGSSPGEWRLPSLSEWEAMIGDALGQGGDPDCVATPPTITNDSGDGCWATGPSSLTDVQSADYWSSSFVVLSPTFAWTMDMAIGFGFGSAKANAKYVWPVRGGQ